jgi:glutamine amidotransferase
MIVVIDYDMGNIGSNLNILKKVGAKARLLQFPEDLLLADKLVLPGVGAFGDGMALLSGQQN